MAMKLGIAHQRSLYADELCFLVQQRRQLINVQLSSAAAVVELVVRHPSTSLLVLTDDLKADQE